MHILNLTCESAEADFLTAELYARGTSGIIEENLTDEKVLLRAFFPSPFPSDDFGAHAPRWEEAETVNWARKIMEDWGPVCVGERFFVVPDWRADPTPHGRIRLEVHPGLALGTGYHPTTQMCLEAMERYLAPGEPFFELGCGAGILSHAAWLLGERRVIACDVDPQATASAAGNFARAGVPALLFTGSAEAVCDSAASFLAANISPEAAVGLSGDIRRVLTPGGHAALSGFPPERSDEVAAWYDGAGFLILDRIARDGWACVVGRRLIR